MKQRSFKYEEKNKLDLFVGGIGRMENSEAFKRKKVQTRKRIEGRDDERWV